jgi:hypothetical protein
MDRRQFLLGAGALALPIPAGNSIAFKVYRNGSLVGEHHLEFTETGTSLSVAINVSLLVTMAMIPVFRYTGQATERWENGAFTSLDSTVNFNGDICEVHAEKTADGYAVVGTNHDNPAKNMNYTAPPDTLPLTYWNKNMLNGTILNPQTAHCYKPHVASPGWNNLPTANGGTITAQRFDVTGKLQLSVWYDAKNSWSGLEFQKSGDISYRKIA